MNKTEDSWSILLKIDKKIKRDKEISKDWNVVNNCAVTNCADGLYKGLKKAFLSFPWKCGAKKNWYILLTKKNGH